jgi:putative ABC transport system permease protein
MALGAQPAAMLRLILRDVMGLMMWSIVLGLPAALMVSSLISTLLFGVTPRDPLSLTLSMGALVAVALFAGYLPSRRASQIDPMTALRRE